MKLSKVLVVLSLVMGLVFMAGNVKAANSMMDNVPGNGAFAYFYASPDCISTVISIFNIDDTANWIHIIAKDQDSEHVWDADVCLTHKGTAVLHVYADDAGVYIDGIGGEVIDVINNEILYMDANEDGAYMGYLSIVAVTGGDEPTAEECVAPANVGKPVDDDILIVTTALVMDNWWVGINGAMVQGLADGDVDDLSGDVGNTILAGVPCVNLYGRWYDDENTRGDLVLVFPVGTDACLPEYEIIGYSYDEMQEKRSFSRDLDEANMIPFGEVLPNVGSGSGWVEIDNTTASAFGYVIVEDGTHCDALPLFKESTEEGRPCPTCTLP